MVFAIAAVRQRRIRRQFREQGAIDRASAKTLLAIGVRNSLAVRRMIRRGVLVAVDDGKYFLSEPAAAEDLYRRRMRAMIVMDLLILAGIVYLIVRWVS